MWMSTPFTERFGCRYPLVQGPMGGGASTPELVAAVSNAGGLGSLGCYHLEPDAIRNAAAEIRRLTDQPFALNLWIPREREDGGTLDPSEAARALARLPRGAYLINTARGPVVDQGALVEALDSGHLAGAGLDVFEREPLDDERLRHHPRAILTPHSAFYSVEGFVELRRKTAAEVRRLLVGEPPRNPVNREFLINPRATMT